MLLLQLHRPCPTPRTITYKRHRISPRISLIYTCPIRHTLLRHQRVPATQPLRTSSNHVIIASSVRRPSIVSLHLRKELDFIAYPPDMLTVYSDHYKDSHSLATTGSSELYHCGKCTRPFTRRVDFIRHLRGSAHFAEKYRCRCGKRFPRSDRFRTHVRPQECHGANSYICLCGYSVEPNGDAFDLLSRHIRKCDDPRPVGRPKKGRMASGELAVSS